MLNQSVMHTGGGGGVLDTILYDKGLRFSQQIKMNSTT